MNFNRVTHNFPPVYDKNSTVLILGTMPSPKSRAAGFYYMHPQNRFWRTLSAILGEPFFQSIEERRQMCLRRGIALWDVLAECEISGASDSSIKNAVPNDIRGLFAECPINAVFTTGKKAHELYGKFFPDLMNDVCLPSPSPANRAVSDSELIKAYRIINSI